VDDLIAWFGNATLGIEARGCGEVGRVRLLAYYPTPGAARRAGERLAMHLGGESGLDPALVDLVDRRVPDGCWVERYQAALRPLTLGRRFLVAPDSVAVPGGERVVLRLTPGRAFGTGEHPTTRMCAGGLEEEVRPGTRWLDLGTGTGILAVVAALCGAASVIALDIDPDAVDIAREVVRNNGVADRVRVAPGSCATLAGKTFDGVVANIAAPYFLESAAEVASLLGCGGVLLASGLLAADEDEVRSALTDSGLVTTGRTEESGWLCLRAESRKRPAAPAGS
jgi:ribosomal protein L11 methyltransferase